MEYSLLQTVLFFPKVSTQRKLNQNEHVKQNETVIPLSCFRSSS